MAEFIRFISRHPEPGSENIRETFPEIPESELPMSELELYIDPDEVTSVVGDIEFDAGEFECLITVKGSLGAIPVNGTIYEVMDRIRKGRSKK